MSLDDVHYEVFLKPGRTAAWRLLEVRETKEDALDLAQRLLRATPNASLRVTKEKWISDDGAFRSYTIFEVGDKFPEDDRADKEGELPCRSPADLCNAHARETIGRALKNWLSREVATPVELLHRVDLVEKLEASGTEYQHAVQKVAIASASSEQANVQKFIKQINALLQRAIETLYTSCRTDPFPTIKKGQFAETVAEIAAGQNKDFRLRGAIAERLMGADSWKAKIAGVLDLADEAEAMPREASEWPLKILGEFLVDLVTDENARNELLGGIADLGDELDAFTDMLGAKDAAGQSQIGKRITKAFAAGRFAEAQRTIARRVLEGLGSPKRLKPGRIRAEIELNRSIADRLIFCVGRCVAQEELVEAFVYRSGRLLDTDAIEALLSTARTTTEEVFALVELEDNIVGDANKAKLAGYVRARLVNPNAENHYLKSAESPMRRLAELAAMRGALEASSFSQGDKAEIGQAFDRFAVELENRVKLFDQITRRSASPLEAAVKMLQLLEKGAVPHGRLGDAARERAQALMASPEAQQAASSGDPAQLGLVQEAARLMTAPPPAPPKRKRAA